MGKQRKYPGKQQVAHNLALRIAHAIRWVQAGWANWMGRWFNSLTLPVKKVLLTVLALGIATYCIYLIAHGITGKVAVEKTFGDIVPPPWTNYRPPDGMSSLAKELREVVDSMRVHDSVGWNAMQRERPGLMDSLAMLEQMMKK